jgi:hypothetical protein
VHAVDVTTPYYMQVLNVADSNSEDDQLRMVSQEAERLTLIY